RTVLRQRDIGHGPSAVAFAALVFGAAHPPHSAMRRDRLRAGRAHRATWVSLAAGGTTPGVTVCGDGTCLAVMQQRSVRPQPGERCPEVLRAPTRARRTLSARWGSSDLVQVGESLL